MTNIEEFMAYCDRRDLRVSRADSGNRVSLAFHEEHVDCHVVVYIDEGAMIQSLTDCSVKVPAGARNEIALALHRANYGLRLGKFELDLRDGELRFHISIPFADELPADKVLDRIVYTGSAMMNRYLPAFLSIIYGNEIAENAVALAEADLGR